MPRCDWRSPRRVVSLVPSLTETLALTAPDLLVGATDWCTHPPGLDVARVRGTKNPDLDAVVALRPDLVVANAEENRAGGRRRAARGRDRRVGRGDPDARRGVRLAGRHAVGVRARAARRGWTRRRPPGPPLPGSVPTPRMRAAVPIWRKPWMVANVDTFTSDLLARLGVDNVFDTPSTDAAGRYPQARPSRRFARAARPSSSCRTSRTRSPRPTGPRRSPASTSRSSAAGT